MAELTEATDGRGELLVFLYVYLYAYSNRDLTTA